MRWEGSEGGVRAVEAGPVIPQLARDSHGVDLPSIGSTSLMHQNWKLWTLSHSVLCISPIRATSAEGSWPLGPVLLGPLQVLANVLFLSNNPTCTCRCWRMFRSSMASRSEPWSGSGERGAAATVQQEARGQGRGRTLQVPLHDWLVFHPISPPHRPTGFINHVRQVRMHYWSLPFSTPERAQGGLMHYYHHHLVFLPYPLPPLQGQRYPGALLSLPINLPPTLFSLAFRAQGTLVRYSRGETISTDLQGARGLFVVVNGMVRIELSAEADGGDGGETEAEAADNAAAAAGEGADVYYIGTGGVGGLTSSLLGGHLPGERS